MLNQEGISEFIFKKVNSPDLITDIGAYSTDQILNNNNDCNMYVGIDSQYYASYKKAYFAIVCAYHYGSKIDENRIGHGIHYVYLDFVDSTTKNQSHRLRMEAIYLMKFASYLIYDCEFKSSDFILEFDYNEVENAFSNQFVEFATNYASSIGVQNINTKPYTVACKAADNIIRNSFKGYSKVYKLYNKKKK
jgi:predicted RNase H-related nuclease YkuK (DUF458 family)